MRRWPRQADAAEEYHAGSGVSRAGQGANVPPRQDVEGKIYERLYGSHGENGDAPTHVIGGDDPAVSELRSTASEWPPALSGSRPEEQAEAPRGRVAVAADALRARARTWLATGSLSAAASRRQSVVAPVPSVARALALVALGIGLVAVAALGAFVPDRATEAPPAGSGSTERADAGPPSADRRRAAELSERRARRARAPREVGSAAESSRRGNGVATVPAGPGTTGQVACSSGGGCVAFRSAPSTGSSGGRVVATGPGDAVVTTPGGAAAGDAGAGALGGSGGSSAGGVAVQP